MVPPGQICVSVGTSGSCLPYYLSPPPVFVPFLSLIFMFPSFPFVPSLCSCLYLPFCFHAFLLRVRASFFYFVFLPSCFLTASSLFFISLVFLVTGVRMFDFVFLSLFYNPLMQRASLQSAEFCAFSGMFPFLVSCFLLLPCVS